MQYHICHTQDVPLGQKKTYTVKNFPVVVVHSQKDEYYAIYGFCPHQRSPLGEGILGGITEADQARSEFSYSREGEIIRCPWHGFSFDVTTGACLTDPDKLRVKTYPLTITNQEIYLDL